MEKPIFVNSDEILLVVYNNGEHVAQSGPFYDEFDILKVLEGTEGVIKVICIDNSTKYCEDISEEIAEAYIKENGILQFNSTGHPFIEESDAFDAFWDEIAKQEYEDALYGTYEQQHRLRPCDVL
ncbi:hypothetical protein [Bartonella sp. CB74]|uniref:hypothetical protein n=1 Tax=Bartonella sp. CB74 TaxID=3113620 RepID=UPI002F96D9AE